MIAGKQGLLHRFIQICMKRCSNPCCVPLQFLKRYLCGTTHLTYVIMVTRTTGESTSGLKSPIVNKATCASINPTMGYDKCEFCDLESTTHTATATINRH